MISRQFQTLKSGKHEKMDYWNPFAEQLPRERIAALRFGISDLV